MKTIFQNEAEVPEALKTKVVKQEDGTYVLEGDGLVKKNQELLDDLKKAKGVADLLKGLDTANLTPEKIRAAISDMEAAEQREAAVQQRIQAAVEENARKHQSKISEAEQRVTAMQSSLEKHLIDSELTRAITSEAGDPMFIAPNLRSRVKVVNDGQGNYVTRVLDAKGEIALDEKGQPRDVLSLVKEAKADKRFASVFTAPPSTGSGAPPSGAGTPGQRTGAPGALVVDASGIVSITREQAKDHAVYREALDLVKGNANKVVIAAPTTLQSTGN